MSGDFEPWNNAPAEPKAPPANASYVGAQKAQRTARIFVRVGLIVGIPLLLGLLWYMSHH